MSDVPPVRWRGLVREASGAPWPSSTGFYGDRAGRFRDPFGHVWIVATRKEALSAEEMQERLDGLFGA